MLGWMRRRGERDVASYVSTGWPFVVYMITDMASGILIQVIATGGPEVVQGRPEDNWV